MSKFGGVVARLAGIWIAALWLVLSAQAASAQLAFTTQFSPDTISEGSGSTQFFSITNGLPTGATDVAFTQTLPPGLTVVGINSATGCGFDTISAPAGGNTITLSNGTVAAGGVCSFGIDVTAPAFGVYNATTSPLTSSQGASGSATDDLTVQAASSALLFSHSFAPSTVPFGGNSTLTYVINNASGGNFFSVSLNETIPAGISIDTSRLTSSDCVGNFSSDASAGTVSQFVNFMTAGTSCSITVPVIGQVTGEFNYRTNGVNYSMGGPLSNTGPTFASLTVTGAAPGAPLFVKAFTNDPVTSSQTVNVRYDITNTDRSFDATNVAFTDDLNAALAGLTFTSLTSNSCGGAVGGVGTGSLSLAGGTIVSNGGTCAVEAVLTVPASSAGSHPGTTGAITATINGAVVAGLPASDTLVVAANPAPTITTSFTDAAGGGSTTYTATISNPGSAAMSAIGFDLTIPTTSPVSAVTASPGAAACGPGSTGFNTVSGGQNVLQLIDGTLAAGDSCTLQWTLAIGGGGAPGSFDLTTSKVVGSVAGEALLGNQSTATLKVGGALDVSFSKVFASPSAVPGGTVNLIFTISVPLEPGIDATNVTFIDDLGAMLANATADSGAGTSSCGGVISGNSVLGFTGATIPAGDTCIVTVPVLIPLTAPAGPVVNNTSTISATPPGGAAESFGLATASLSITSISATGSFGSATVVPGQDTTLTITLQNDGPDAATGAFFTLPFQTDLGTGAQVISGTTTTDTCGGSYSGTTFGIYSGGTIPAGSTCEISMTVTTSAAASAGTVRLITSDISATVGGSASTVNGLVAPLTYEPGKLLFGKSFATPSAEAGGTVALTFNIQNIDTSNSVSDVRFVDDLDAFISLASVSNVTANTCGATVNGTGTGLIDVDGGTIAAGASCQITVVVDVPPGITGEFENETTSIVGELGGFIVSGDVARATLEVISPDRPTFTTSFAPASVPAGGTTTITYQISNPVAGGALGSAQFSHDIDSIIAGATVSAVAGSCGAGSNASGGGSTITLTDGALAAGESCTLTATVTTPFVSAGSYASLTSPLTSSGLEVAAAASATLEVVSVAPLFAQSVNTPVIEQGGVSTLNFSVDNSANADVVTGLAFNVNLPAGVSIAATPNASNTCSGMIAGGSAGATNFSFGGGQAAGAASCTVQIDVTSTTIGVAGFPQVALANAFAPALSGTTSLSVTAAPQPGFTAAFAPSSIVQGATTTLTYTINNTALIPASSMTFSTVLSNGLQIATPSLASTTCSAGSVTAASGGGLLTFSVGGTAASSSCTVQVSVASTAPATATITSGDLTSNLGNSGGASAGLTVSPAPTPTATAVFAPASFPEGGSSTLTVSFNNAAALVDAAGLGFSANLPANLVVATPSNVASTCASASPVAATGGNAISLAGATVSAGNSCTFSVNVTSVTALSDTFSTGAITSSLGNTAAAMAPITVTAAPAPTFIAAFAPASVEQGQTSTLTFTINNAASLLAAGGLGFVNDLPAGVVIDDTPLGSSTCSGGTVNANAGAISFSYAGGSVDAGLSCTVQVAVTADTALTGVNTSGDLTSSLGNSGPASATLTVTAAPAPGFAAAFAPASIVQGDVTRLTYTVDNLSASVPATGAGFTNTLPGDLLVADPAGASTTCSAGTVLAAPGSNTVTYSGGTIGSLTSCFVHLNVTAAAVGASLNTTGDLISNLGNSGPATASLNVTPAPVPGFSLSIAPGSVDQGGVATVTGEITNTALVSADALSVEVPFPAGVTEAPALNFVSDCTGATSAPGAGPGLNVSATTLAAGASCSFSFDIRASDVGVAVVATGPLNSSLGATAGASATISVTAAGLPTFTASFAPDTIVQGNVTTLSLVVDNSANLIAAENGSFSIPIPAGLELATNPNPQAICTDGPAIGTPFIAPDGSAAGVTGLEVSAGAMCTYSVDLTSSTEGATTLTTTALVTSLGSSGSAAAILQVNLAPVPELTAAYSPDTVMQGAMSTLTFTIDNAPNLVEVTGLTFGQTLPAGLRIAAAPNASTTCTGGAVTAAGGDSDISFAMGAVDASGTCTVSVDVVGNDAGTATTTSSVLASSQGSGATGATASLIVNGAPAPLFAAAYVPDSIVQGATTVLTYSIDNTASLVDATALAFSETLPDGVAIAATPDAATTCGSGTVTATADGDTLSLAAGTVTSGGTCTVSVSVTSVIVGDVTGTSGDLTSDLGNSGPASATLSVTAADGPTFAKAFAPDTVVQGEVSTLTFTIDNASALVAATDIAFNDPMPTGMFVSETANVTSTCTGGNVSAEAGSSTISLEAATLAAAASCTISVDVVLIAAEAATNVTEDLTSSLGNSGPATATLTATPATAPTFAKAFAPNSIAQGEISRLVFTIDNAAAAVDVTDLAFTDNFPAGLTIASTPDATTTCGSVSLTAGAATATFAMTGGTVAAGASCEVSVNVTATVVDTYVNTSGDLTSSLGNSGTASATLTVAASAAPLFNSRYSPPSIVQGGTTRLLLIVDNTGGGVPASGLGFDVSLPAGLFVEGDPTALGSTARPDLENTCGGTSVGEANATTVTLDGGTVGAASTCTVSVNVTSETTGTLGPVSGNLRSSLGGSTLAADTTGPLVVETNPEGQLTIIQNASEDGTFSFSSTLAALNFSITTTGGSGSAGPISVAEGTYVLQQARPDGVGNTALSCSDNDSSGDPFTGTLTLNVAANEAITCTFSSLSTQQKTTEVINSFLNRRNNLILSNGPSRARRLDRLRQGVGGSETLTYQNGDLKSFAPASFNLLSAGSGSYSISTSLYQVERAALMFGLAHDGIEGNSAIYNPRRFDIWFEAHYNEFKASQGSSGHFGIAYLGADYLVTEDILAGAMLQFDTLDDSSPTTNSSVSGRGWMVGPYLTARIAPNLIFDGRIAYGKSVNQIRPFNTYEDEFDTNRFLIDASISGNYDWENWVVTPNLSISYIEERQKAYVDSLNVAIPGQKVSLGQIKFGPTFSTTIKGRNHSIIEPSFTVNGIYNFGNRSGPVITNNTADESDGLRARIEAAVRITNRYGTKLEFGANYDGIGANDFESWGANFKLTVPLQ